jgi:hypothetical protein
MTLRVVGRSDQPATDTIGPACAWVRDAEGRRYLADEQHDRIVIEEADGTTTMVGERGVGLGQFRAPLGIALLEGSTRGDTLLFVCDTLNHRVQVLDGNGTPLLAFGRYGHTHGCFAAPADIAIVTPELPGDTVEDTLDQPLIAVADQWNGRVQILTLAGVLVATIGSDPRRPRPEPPADMLPHAGWPFFRLTEHPILPVPAQLEWRAPFLDVTCGDGQVERIDLAIAMLPDLQEWRRQATEADRARARRYFTLMGGARSHLSGPLLELLGADEAAAA